MQVASRALSSVLHRGCLRIIFLPDDSSGASEIRIGVCVGAALALRLHAPQQLSSLATTPEV